MFYNGNAPIIHFFLDTTKVWLLDLYVANDVIFSKQCFYVKNRIPFNK